MIVYLKTVVRQHNDLASAAIEQKQTLYSFFKNRCASAQRLSLCGD